MSCRWTCSGCFKPWRGSRGTILITFTTRRRPAGCRSGPGRIRAPRTGPRGGTIRTSTCCTSRPTARYRYSSRAGSRSCPLTGRCCSTCRRTAASPPSSIRKKVSVPFDTGHRSRFREYFRALAEPFFPFSLLATSMSFEE